MKKVRVLSAIYINDEWFQPNSVLCLPDASVEHYKAFGNVSDSENAVAYCEDVLGVESITIGSEPEPEPQRDAEPDAATPDEKTETKKDNTKNTKSAKK